MTHLQLQIKGGYYPFPPTHLPASLACSRPMRAGVFWTPLLVKAIDLLLHYNFHEDIGSQRHTL